MKTNRILIKGAGDLASGVALRLHRAGYLVAMTDLAEPTAIRWTVSFCPAILQGTAMVEDVRGRLAKGEADALAAWAAGEIPILVDPQAACRSFIQPQVLVDAILAKRNLGTSIQDAPAVIALGPGFTAGVDCHAVVETMRGHNLGRVYYQGSALPNTGVPGEIGGFTKERVMHAPAGGTFRAIHKIGDRVEAGETIARVDGVPVITHISGILRGILTDGLQIPQGMKCADVDPRCQPNNCFTVSDKARSLGGAVLEAMGALGQL